MEHKKTILLFFYITLSIFLIFSMYLFKSNTDFKYHVETKIFDECFDYYAESNKEFGIAITSIDTCVSKSAEWSDELFDK